MDGRCIGTLSMGRVAGRAPFRRLGGTGRDVPISLLLGLGGVSALRLDPTFHQGIGYGMATSEFSVIVFPFLKTSGPVPIGPYLFRSTLDTEGLPADQAKALGDISRMLFVKDDLRVVSASYAVIPYIDLDRSGPEIERLAELRAAVAYIYSAPHEIFDGVFLPPESVSFALFSPGPVSVFLVRPEHHTEPVTAPNGPPPDGRHQLAGYAGRYNFTHPFWVEAGSRLYGPAPHIGLNIGQDLARDLDPERGGRPDRVLLLRLLTASPSPVSERIFTALRWYNAANEVAAGPDRALLDLAIAFEALFALPADAKTDRLTDAIALLLGRTERLGVWARQFYAARSSVAHEGVAHDRYYDAAGHLKDRKAPDRFGSLMLYGRQIFQLSLATLLVGADLARGAGLQARFVSNVERFTLICAGLRPEAGTPSERLRAIEALVLGLERFRFVDSGPLPIEPMLGAVRAASSALLACQFELDDVLAEALRGCGAAARKDNEFGHLAAVERLVAAFNEKGLPEPGSELRIVRDLVEAVWDVVFMRYFQLKEAQPAADSPASS
ncbi:MAG: hypothetical protein JWR80_6011 [Bradyrhizobium sp.]|nr:hypothetical protein [Bradyrhizobium sp.]